MNTSRQVIVNASAHSIPLPDGMIHTVACSPPYYSLRQYQGEQEIDWPAMSYSPMPGLPPLEIEPMRCALGLEPQPESYIGHLVLCFREVYRVMRDDAVAWVVMGDSFASTAQGTRNAPQPKGSHSVPEEWANYRPTVGLEGGNLMLIPHRLALALQADSWIVRNDVVWAKVAPMPESVSGWHWSRHQVKVAPSDQQHIPGSDRKRSNVPGAHASVGTPANAEWTPCPGCDKCGATGGYVLRRGSWRHTRAHETILQCTKQMGYYADQERVREETANYDRKGGTATWECDGATTHGIGSDSLHQMSKNGRNPRSVLTADPLEELWGYFLEWMEMRWDGNPMDVLTPSLESYPGSHYAVFPRTLIAPLLRATAPMRVCPVCGAPWCPVVERGEPYKRPDSGGIVKRLAAGDAGQGQTDFTTSMLGRVPNIAILDHRPTCSCIRDRKPDVELSSAGWLDVADEVAAELAPIPGWALDPFAGTFTTGEVCAELGVNCIGLDISHEYLDDHAKPRIGLTPSGALDDLPLFAELEVLA